MIAITMRPLRSLAFGAAIGAMAAGCIAGTASGIFDVQIILHTSAVTPSPGLPDGAPGQLPETPPIVSPPVLPGRPVPPPSTPDGPVAQPAPPEQGATSADAPQLVRPQLARLAPRSICTSQSGDSASGSTVRVACSPGQFALIQPVGVPGILARRTTSWRYAFSPADPLPTALSQVMNLRIGAGTITALRITHIEDLLDPMEMLVSF